MSPVQEGSVVVYVIDNSDSIRDHKEALFDAFDDLTGRASLPNVELAAVKHGFDALGRTPSPAMETLKNSLFAFRPPDDTLVNTLRKKLSFNNGVEQLYPGIMAAWEMIDDECLPGDLVATKPWCEHKVIVVLGGGDPGVFPTNKHYFRQPYADANLPTNLLSGLNKAGIKVDTLCVGSVCEARISSRCEWIKGSTHIGPPSLFVSWCLASPADLLGSKIMQELSSRTGGDYHGIVK